MYRYRVSFNFENANGSKCIWLLLLTNLKWLAFDLYLYKVYFFCTLSTVVWCLNLDLSYIVSESEYNIETVLRINIKFPLLWNSELNGVHHIFEK